MAMHMNDIESDLDDIESDLDDISILQTEDGKH